MNDVSSFDTTPTPVKLRVEDFLLLHEAGVFDRFAKTELTGGTIVATNAQFSLHARVKSRLFRRLADAIDAVLPECEAWTEVSVSIPPNDLPEPDIVVATFTSRAREPVAVDTVRLLVEVADTTLKDDLGAKGAVYAAAGVPEYWVVDVNGLVIHQMWTSDGAAYVNQDRVSLDTPITAATIDGLTIDTSGL